MTIARSGNPETNQTPDIPPTEPGPLPLAEPSETPSRLDRIARRAHQIYEMRGGNGRSLDDWLQAEREIDHAD